MRVNVLSIGYCPVGGSGMHTVTFNRFSRLKFQDRDLSVSTPRVLLPIISCNETITSLVTRPGSEL